MGNGFLFFYYSATILSFGLLGISLLFGSLRFSVFDYEQKGYLYYLAFIFFIELLTKLLIFFNKENMFVYPFYIAGEFFLLSRMFIIGIHLPRKLFFISWIISISLFVESLSLWFFNKNITLGYGKTISHLIIICLSGFYLIQAIKVFEWEKQNKFLIIYGCLFLYYSVSLFLFLLLNQLTTVTINNASVIWGINNMLSSVLYGISFYTFLKLKKSE